MTEQGQSGGRGAGGTPALGPHAPIFRAAFAHDRAGRLDEAAALYRKLLELDPAHAPALFRLGQLTARLGRHRTAADLLRRAIRSDPARADFQVNLATVLLEVGDAEAAEPHAARALELAPDDLPALRTMATIHERRHRLDEARALFERALALDADYADAAIGLARIERRTGALESARARLERTLDRAGLPPGRRQAALSDLAMTLDKLGAYDEAFPLFERAGAEACAAPAARRIDPEARLRAVAAYRSGVDADLCRRFSPADLAGDGAAPVLLAGFPRSGTTMTEQVLAALPDVVTTDERPLLHAVRERARGMVPDAPDLPAVLRALDRDQVLELRGLYRVRAEAETGRPLGRGTFIDKLPLNLIELALVNVVFPDARVIIALRDPRDVCLSCLMQNFPLNEAMINFTSLQRTVRFYDRVMDLWRHLRGVISLRFVEVRYEDTVRDLETQARRLLDLLDLDWNPAVLDFHVAARARYLSTPSYAAVTEPVHTRAIGRWRNYERFFAPHADVLAPWVEAFGEA